MNLTDCPVPVYGDTMYRGRCPDESYEQMSFFNRLRKEYPDTWGLLGFHPRNEGLREEGQFASVIHHKAEGQTNGVSDIVIIGSPAFVCEVKRQDCRKSKWQPGQKEFLQAATDAGAFSCLALGAEAAWQAFEEWRRVCLTKKENAL